MNETFQPLEYWQLEKARQRITEMRRRAAVLEKRVAELEAELAAVYEKTGADFEKVRFVDAPESEPFEGIEGSRQ